MTRTAYQIIDDVSRAFNVNRERLRQPISGGWIDMDASKARQAAYLILREQRALSYGQIARMLHREQSSVRHGILRAAERVASDAEFAARYEEARQG